MAIPAHVTERDGEFQLFDLSRPTVGADFRPAATISVPTGIGGLHGIAAHPSLQGLAYVTATELVRLAADGRLMWRIDMGRPGSEKANTRASEALMDRGSDRLLIVDDTTGAIVAAAQLETSGHGAGFYAHADGSMIVDVGEGQDGVHILRCRLLGGSLNVEAFPRIDRVLIGFSPDGSQFMTVHHGSQKDVAFHSYPAGKVQRKFAVRAFGRQPRETAIEWAGGLPARERGSCRPCWL
jgi:hypothetical protein